MKLGLANCRFGLTKRYIFLELGRFMRHLESETCNIEEAKASLNITSHEICYIIYRAKYPIDIPLSSKYGP